MYVVRRRGTRNVERMQHEMEDTFNALVAADRAIRVRVATRAVWRPPLEAFETEHGLHVAVELAGIEERDVEVVVDDHVMTIRGERRPQRTQPCRSVHAMGILYGPFATDVYLPFAIDADRVEATYEAGMLRINLPRATATTITITTADDRAQERTAAVPDQQVTTDDSAER